MYQQEIDTKAKNRGLLRPVYSTMSGQFVEIIMGNPDLSYGKPQSSIGNRPQYVIYGTEDMIYPAFVIKMAGLNLDDVAIFRAEGNFIKIWVFCERLEEAEADEFYSKSLEFQRSNNYIEFDIRLIERRGRTSEEFGIQKNILRPMRSIQNALVISTSSTNRPQ
jgi:hypothetical protein